MSQLFAPFAVDNYKVGHIRMMPANTTRIYTNFTARNHKYFTALPDFDGKMVVFGIQHFIRAFLIDQWNDTFFRIPREEAVNKYQRRVNGVFGPDVVSADQIGALHDLQYLPLHIKALPEGSRVPMEVPYMTLVNTHDDFEWLTNYLETITSCWTWKSCVNASTAFELRRMLTSHCALTGGDTGALRYQAHDFSMRGLSGLDDATFNGMAHLTSFYGSDTLPAIDAVYEYYDANDNIEPVGNSVPATEHSVMCMGQEKGEYETYRRLIEDLYPSGILSIVSDTWDYFRVLTEYLPRLKPLIIARWEKTGGKVVLRPDSGEPVDIICGDPNAPVGSPEYKGTLRILAEIFGVTINDAGFKVLHPCIGAIYGDSINLTRGNAILTRMREIGFASTNIVFGPGSYTYQMVTRDTFSIAAKATYAIINNEGINIQKDPKTGGGKKSARGLLRVEEENGTFVLYQEQTPEQEAQGALRTVFLNSQTDNMDSIHTIRRRLDAAVY